VRCAALGRQCLALGHAEPVLLVDDRQAQVGEGHVLLYQRVGAHHDPTQAEAAGGAIERRTDQLQCFASSSR
jgi:hypothetical protein